MGGGTIEIFGISHRKTESRARLAYLPERFNPPFYLTGRDFLQYMAKMHRAAYDEAAAVQVLQELDLAPAALDKAVRAYSKGMNQKLGLAACMLSGKDLFILDEPTSGLDPRARILLKRKLKALNDAGMASSELSVRLVLGGGSTCAAGGDTCSKTLTPAASAS